MNIYLFTSSFHPRAAINNHSGLVEYIGSLSSEFVNETTKNNKSALILAVQCGHFPVVEELLKLKVDFTIRDDSHRTVLHYAIAYPEILRILLKVCDFYVFSVSYLLSFIFFKAIYYEN